MVVRGGTVVVGARVVVRGGSVVVGAGLQQTPTCPPPTWQFYGCRTEQSKRIHDKQATSKIYPVGCVGRSLAAAGLRSQALLGSIALDVGRLGGGAGWHRGRWRLGGTGWQCGRNGNWVTADANLPADLAVLTIFITPHC